MHPPFIVVTWPPGPSSPCQPPAEAASGFEDRGWSLAVRRPGLALWHRPERPLPLSEGRDHLVLGRWWGNASTLTAMDARPGPPLCRARSLSRDGWGAYVALLRDPVGEDWWAFRDPSGAVEALTWPCGDYRLLASSLEGMPLGWLPHRMALDWRVIAEQLRHPVAQFARSALRDVVPIAPGDLQPLGASADAAVAIWRPRDFLPGDELAPDPAWPGRLAETVASVVATMTRPYSRVVTEASGGLDSSIVSAAVARAAPAGVAAMAVHYVGDRPEADERRWVDLLCRRYGLPLTCLPLGVGPIDPENDFAPEARDARPPFAAIDSDRDRDAADLLAATGAEALVSGKGGDAVFFQMPSPAVLADLWRAGGLRAARHPRHAEVAGWLRRSVWSLWRDGWRGLPPKPAGGALGRLAGPCLGPPSAAAPHPWLVGLEGVPPGKRLQIEALASSQLALGPHRRGRVADLVQPLLSQPVMELCLSISTWELVRGGRDRGLAREAFGSWLPDALAYRRSKGNLTSHYARRTAASATVLRTHLLGGVLADAGLLDHAATEAALQPDSLIWRADGVDLIGVAAIESWVRYWQTRAPDVPAASRTNLSASA